MFDRHFAAWPPGLPRTLEPPRTTLPENLEITVRRFGGRTAIHYYGTAISWAEIGEQVERLAGWLQRVAGVEKTDRVLLYMQNAPQFIIGYYAIMRAGAVVVPVNPMSRSEELRHIAEDTGARVLIAGQELFEHAAALLGGHPLTHAVVGCYGDCVRGPTDLAMPEVVSAPRMPITLDGAVSWAEMLAAEHEPAALDLSLDDWCVLPFSSGTTGRPKGCLHTHRTVGFTMYAGVVWSNVSPESVSLVSMPLFHVTGMQSSMNALVFQGATLVMTTRWDRRLAAELIRRHRITNFRCITTMAIDLLSDPDVERFDLTSLRAISGGGAQMPKAIAQKLRDLTGLEYVEGYGLTETIAPTHMNPPLRPKPQCAGIPIFDTDSRVIDPETLVELDTGEVGEIVTHGPQVFLGYWNQPQATAEVFLEIDGKRFFRTGDLGYFDEDGYFFLVDRLKRMINVSGFKVWPAEIEAMMYEHPEIREVCVISTPDARRGEAVKAVIVPSGPSAPDADRIRDWCRDRMAAYKVPTVIAYADAIPRSGSGKVLWRVLQDQEPRSIPDASTQGAA